MVGSKLNFTKASIDRLQPAQTAKREIWHDTQVSGLQVCVTDKGSKSFFVRRKVRGNSERFHLGRHPDLTIEQARRRAQEIIGQVASGSPAADIRGNRAAHATLGQLYDSYIESYAKPHKKTWKLDAAQFRLYLIKLRGRRLDSISREEIVKLHGVIGRDRGQYAANRLLSLLSKLFNFAIEMKLLAIANPVAGIRRFRESARERFLRPEELPSFVKALEQEENATARDFFWLALLTGQRMSNVLAMRWVDVDLVRAEWRIPETKNGTPHTVPLPSQALAILVIRKQMVAGSFVLPGKGRTGHMVQPKKAWERILKRSALANLRIHDLRHTLASWQACTGASLLVIGRTLNHKTPAATHRYAHFYNDPVRQAITVAVDAMFKAANADVEENAAAPPTN